MLEIFHEQEMVNTSNIFTCDIFIDRSTEYVIYIFISVTALFHGQHF